MPPILDLIAEREAAATAAADTLREQIAKLTDELALAETNWPNSRPPANPRSLCKNHFR